MARWRDLGKEDLKRSFGAWERHEAMSVIIVLIITGFVSFLATLGIIKVSDLDNIGIRISIGLGIWFALLVFIVTPIRMLKDKADDLTRLKTKRLKISLSSNHEPGDGSHWLRLRVDNPSGEAIPNCYGKLDSYTMLLEVEGQSKRVTDVLGGASLNQGLPPERHPFPWASTNTPDATTTIGAKDHEFLYIAVLREQGTYFYTPTDMGLKYPKVKINCQYEVVIDIGSESEAFYPTKIRLLYGMTGRTIEAKAIEIINESSSDKEDSRNE